MALDLLLNQVKNRLKNISSHDTRAIIATHALVATLIFCFSRDRGNHRSLDRIRKFVQSTLGISLSRGGFWERLATKKLQKIFEGLAASMVKNFASKLLITSGLLNVLKVSAILILDASSSSLPKAAKKLFPAPRNNVAPAAIELHLCFNLFQGAIEWFNLTPATRHDRTSFPPIHSLIGKLIIFDLGYRDYQLMADIKAIGGFFLTRVKSNASIDVVSVISGLPKKNFEGWSLFDRRLPKRKSKIVEVIGQFSQNYNPILTARVLGFWNPTTHEYHWYVTNLDAPASLIYPLYRLRWQLELVFKTFKSCFRLADLPTANPKIIYVLVYSAIISNMIAYPIAYALAQEFESEKQFTPSLQRAGMIILHCATDFIDFLLSKSENSIHRLKKKLNLLKKELFDPNWKNRETSMARAIRMATTIV